MRVSYAKALLPLLFAATSAIAETPRDLLTRAAYEDRNPAAALARVNTARAQALTMASHDADDQDAAVVAAIALAYRAKLTGNRGEARGRALVDAATRGTVAMPLDRINQRAAGLVAAALHRDDRAAASALADRLLPFGWVRKG